ncbi:hypothetical protein ACEQPO_15710 [Bacillus sp. SL00103]
MEQDSERTRWFLQLQSAHNETLKTATYKGVAKWKISQQICVTAQSKKPQSTTYCSLP